MLQTEIRASSKMTRQVFQDLALDAEFKDRGYVVYPSFLTLEDMATLRDIYAGQSSELKAGFHASMYCDDIEYRRNTGLRIREIYNRRIASILHDYTALIGNFMVKEPEDPQSEMPLHQDWSFVAEPEMASVHVWCPLLDVGPENGCLAVVPGSHHLSDPVRAFADDCPFRETFDFIRERYLLELPLKAGDAVFYNGSVIHGSRSNTSSERRLAVQSITVPKEARVQFAWRVSPSQVELFDVDDEFFPRYQLHTPPQGVPSAGIIDYAVHQLTPDQVTAALDPYR